jgi:hypothetical protein
MMVIRPSNLGLPFSFTLGCCPLYSIVPLAPLTVAYAVGILRGTKQDVSDFTSLTGSLERLMWMKCFLDIQETNEPLHSKVQVTSQ